MCSRGASRNILAERSRKLVLSEIKALATNNDGASKADSVDTKPVKISKAHCLQRQVESIAEIGAGLKKVSSYESASAVSTRRQFARKPTLKNSKIYRRLGKLG